MNQKRLDVFGMDTGLGFEKSVFALLVCYQLCYRHSQSATHACIQSHYFQEKWEKGKWQGNERYMDSARCK